MYDNIQTMGINRNVLVNAYAHANGYAHAFAFAHACLDVCMCVTLICAHAFICTSGPISYKYIYIYMNTYMPADIPICKHAYMFSFMYACV